MTKKKENTNKERPKEPKIKTKIGSVSRMWQHIRRSPFQSFAAILVMWLNYFMAGLLVVVILVFGSLLNYFESRPEVTAFLRDDLTSNQVELLQQEIKQQEGVKEIRFVSKQEALEIYREQNKDNPLLLEMVNADILPASIEISAESPEYLSPIADFLEGKTEAVQEVIFQKDVVQKLSFWVKNIRNAGLVMMGVYGFVSLIVIMVIIGMKIAAHRDEIAALRSIGAGRFYIQFPFLLEGIFYGVIGALLGEIMIAGGIYYWRDQILNFFAPISVLPTEPNTLAILLGGQLGVGLLLGLVAAWLASRRYIKG
jgi:cell division transport system permease protein